MWQHRVSLRGLQEFGDDRVGQYSARLGISRVDSEVLPSSGLQLEDDGKYSSIQSSKSEINLGGTDKKVEWGSWDNTWNLRA